MHALAREGRGGDLAEVRAIPEAQAEPARQRQINLLEDPALVRHLAAHPEDWNDLRRAYLLEQAHKIPPLARLVSELGLWGELNRTIQQEQQADFEKRAVGC